MSELQQQQVSQGVAGSPAFNMLSNNAVGSALLNPGRGVSALPTNEALNSLHLMGQFDDEKIFKRIAQRDMAFVKSAAKLLERDPWLRQQMGGASFENTLALSGMIKTQFGEWLMKARTMRVIPQILDDLGFSNAEAQSFITGSGVQRTMRAPSVAGLFIDKKGNVDEVIAELKKNKNFGQLGPIQGILSQFAQDDGNKAITTGLLNTFF